MATYSPRAPGAYAFEPPYFSDASWADRVASWMQASQRTFSDGNAKVVSTAIGDEDSGLRVVMNISTTALLAMLTGGVYLNLYQRPAIGDARPQPSADRIEVDRAMDIDGHTTYFAAVALGGAGVRYYGEYCMVLDLSMIDRDPQLFDRDSYDILISPISESDRATVVRQLKGHWNQDVRDMVLMKVLPDVIHDRQLVTTGTVSDLVLKDQEFIEVHMHSPSGFGPEAVEEIRESPDEVAVATRLAEREGAGEALSDVEHKWLTDREAVARMMRRRGVRTRVVTQVGRGYQWK